VKEAKGWRQSYEQIHSQLQDVTSKHNKLLEDRAVLATDKRRLDNGIKSLQMTSFRSLENAHWMPLDAGTISAKLDNIRASIGAIAKVYSATADTVDVIDEWSADSLLHLRSSLEHVVRFQAEDPDAITELKTIPQAYRLCLTALISYDVHNLVLREPFFFMLGEPQETAEHGAQDSVKQAFHDVWSDGCDCKETNSA